MRSVARAVKRVVDKPVHSPMGRGGGVSLPREGLLFYSKDGVTDSVGVSPKIWGLPQYQGTVWHVDASRPDDTGDGLTRSSAKKSILAAYNTASTGDTILIANGTYSLSSGLGISKRLLVIGQSREGVIINALSSGNNFTFNTGGTGSTFLNFTIGGVGATNRYIFENVLGNNVFIGFFNVESSVVSRIAYIPTNKFTFSNFLAKGSGGFLNGGGTLILNFAQMFESGTGQSAAVNNTSTGITVVNKSAIIGGRPSVSTVRCSGGSLTINNSIIAAPGEMIKYLPAAAQTGGALTINDSIICGSANKSETLYSGTVTRNRVKENVSPGFLNKGKGVGIVSIYALDSNVMTGGVNIEPLQAGADRAGIHVSIFVDDHDHLPTDQQNRLKQFVESGHDLGVEGNASSDLANTQPCWVQYIGPDTGCTLTIANNIITVTTVEGTDNFSYDISKTSLYKLLGDDLVFNINNKSNFNAALNTTNYSYDDAYSYCLADGTYDLSGGGQVLLSWDMDKYLTEEVVISKQNIESIIGGEWECKSYYYARYVYSALAKTYIKAAGFESAWYGQNGYINLNSTGDIFAMSHEYINGFGNLRGTGYDALDAAGKEARIRGSAVAMAEAVVRYGLWESILIPTPDLSITEDEVFWFCDELVKSGVMVLSFAEAISYIKTNGTALGGDSYGLNLSMDYNSHIGATSPCINSGTSSFSDGDGDQYDLDGNMVWSDVFDAPVYNERSGVDIGPHTYGSGDMVLNTPTVVSGTYPNAVLQWPTCPTLKAADDGTIYTGATPNHIDLSAFIDTAWMRAGEKGLVIYNDDQDTNAIAKIDKVIGNS